MRNTLVIGHDEKHHKANKFGRCKSKCIPSTCLEYNKCQTELNKPMVRKILGLA